jgi:hypothetical protein
MQNTPNKTTYVVYNPDTFAVVDTPACFTGVMTHLRENPALKWLNTTYPHHQPVLKSINQVNKTNYGFRA